LIYVFYETKGFISVFTRARHWPCVDIA